jgi:DDE superfamily endonuclease/Helix-turn-helix of DDE superfamily endonuclease
MTPTAGIQKKTNKKFIRMIGINKEAFRILSQQLQLEIEKIQLLNPKSKRGKKAVLDLDDQLMLCFMYLRNYPTFIELGERFGISESYSNKVFHKIAKILINILKLPSHSELAKENIGTVIVDASEQAIERPSKGQKDYYSGKKGQHTIKAQLLMSLDSLMILKINCCKGSIHDFKLFKNSNLKLKDNAVIMSDLGYVGIKKIFKNALIPYKSSKNNPLTEDQKKFNKLLSKQRIVVENKIRECKIFRIVKSVFRGKHKNYGLFWNLIAGIVNFKNSTKHFQYAN